MQTVEDLERYAGPDGPFRHDRRHLVIIQRSDTHQRHLGSELGTLQSHILGRKAFRVRYLPQQRVPVESALLEIIRPFDIAEDKHIAGGSDGFLAVERAAQCAFQGFDGFLRLQVFPFGLGGMHLRIEPLALGDDPVVFQRDRIRQMVAHSVKHLLAHFDHLHRKGESVITFGKFRHQPVTRLRLFLRRIFDLDLRRVVRRVDLTAGIDRNGDVGRDGSETAILQFHRPIPLQQSLGLLQNGRRSSPSGKLPRIPPTGPFRSFMPTDMSSPI